MKRTVEEAFGDDPLGLKAARAKIPFSKRSVTITMTGEEWTMILARLLDKPLSRTGSTIYYNACKKLNKRLLEASE